MKIFVFVSLMKRCAYNLFIDSHYMFNLNTLLYTTLFFLFLTIYNYVSYYILLAEIHLYEIFTSK